MCLLRRDCGFLLWRLIKVDQIINQEEEETRRPSSEPMRKIETPPVAVFSLFRRPVTTEPCASEMMRQVPRRITLNNRKEKERKTRVLMR
jgi:hypothetical protein